jgi:hypothetical protein
VQAGAQHRDQQVVARLGLDGFPVYFKADHGANGTEVPGTDTSVCAKPAGGLLHGVPRPVWRRRYHCGRFAR